MYLVVIKDNFTGAFHIVDLNSSEQLLTNGKLMIYGKDVRTGEDVQGLQYSHNDLKAKSIPRPRSVPKFMVGA